MTNLEYNNWQTAETIWTIDDAIEALADLNRNEFQMDYQVEDEILIGILNDTLASSYVKTMIYETLKENIGEYLEQRYESNRI